jgi:hypothetical protein
MATKYHVFNATDGVYVTHTPLLQKAAMVFIEEFPKRFEHQGYYKTRSGDRIDPKDVMLELHPRDKKLSLSLCIAIGLFLSVLCSCSKNLEDMSFEGHRHDTATVILPSWVDVPITNGSFEQKLTGWDVEYQKPGAKNFTIKQWPDKSGHYLNFYATQAGQWAGSQEQTPFSGSVTQVLTDLSNGIYRLSVYGQKYGNNMYIVANDKQEPLMDFWGQQSIDFEVTDGDARIGLVCVNADGTPPVEPSCYVDFFQLQIRQ